MADAAASPQQAPAPSVPDAHAANPQAQQPAPADPYNVGAALKAGYSPTDVADFLGSHTGLDIAGARKAGYSDSEIASHLATLPAPSDGGPGTANGAPTPQQPSAMGPAVDRLVSQAQAPIPAPPSLPSWATGGSGSDAALRAPGAPISSGAPVPMGNAPRSDEAIVGEAAGTIAARVGNALIEGWKDTPDLLTPQAQQWLANAERNNPRPNLQDVLTVGHAAMAAGNAVFRGGLEGIAALGAAVGQPQLGNDVAGYYESMGVAGVPHMPGVLRSTMPETRAALTEQALGARNQGMPTLGGVPSAPAVSDILNAGSVDDAISQAASVASKPPAFISDARQDADARAGIARQGVAVPQSVGAAASRDLTNLALITAVTPAQKATALQKMVNQSAEDRMSPQGRDDNVYVPGVERPEAMRDFTPAAEGELSSPLAHKALYNTDSNYHDQFDAQVKKNNGVMVDQLGDLMGDANSRDAAMTEAKELMPGPVGLFNGEKPVDAQPIVDEIKDILASPAGKRDAVISQLGSLLPKLYDWDGNLETMPSMLKGIRDNITDRLYDKSPTAEGNAARTARSQLQDVLAVVDQKIGEGLPGTKYQDYLANLSAALGQVSKQDYLQKFLTGPRKLTDPAGQLVFRKVQAMLEDIQAHQADRTGGAKELTMPEINQIEAVRNELAAKDALDRRAGVRGSPTTQLTNATGVLGSGPLGAAIKGGAEVALHAGLAATTGGIGNAALASYRFIVKPAIDAAKANQAAAALAATKQRLLDTTPRPGAAP